MIDSTCAYAVPGTIVPISRDRSLIVPAGGDDVPIEVDALAAQLYGICIGVRRLEDHAETARRAGIAQEPGAIGAAIDRLLAVGLLRSPRDWLAGVDDAMGERAISAVTVITADRPHLLARSLGSIVPHCNTATYPARLIVIDGSRREDHRQMNLATAEALRGEVAAGILYVGHSEAALFRRSLASRGLSPKTLDFGLTPGPPGSNRNLAMILTLGENVVTVDDDVILTPWTHEGSPDGLTCAGHLDLREHRFFANRAAALAAVTPSSINLLNAHATLLGRRLVDLLADDKPADLRHACAHMIRALSARGDHTVRVTGTGLVGDSGIWCRHRQIFALGTLRDRLLEDEETFALALRSREVLRIARRNTVSHDSACMAYCMGISNRSPMPPFVPQGRNQDGVFGATLAFADDSALFGHIPYGIVHDSDRSSSGDGRTMPSASSTRLADLLTAIITSVRGSVPSLGRERRLQRLASAMADIARLDLPEFRSFVIHAILSHKARQIGNLETAIATASAYPHYWIRAFEEYRRCWQENLQRPPFCVPIELAVADSVDAGFRRTQAFLADYANLIDQWPNICAAARDVGLTRV